MEDVAALLNIGFSRRREQNNCCTNETQNMPTVKQNSAPTSFLASLTNGFRSGLISPAPSTTPITPMTPLTTPRTPAQALIGRHPYINRKDSNGSTNNNQRSRPSTPSQLPLLSDHDREQQLVALQLFANFLNAAENAIEDIYERENDGKRVVGPGIMRLCNDLADGIEQVAEELDREHQHIEKVMSDHDLRLIEEGSKEGDSNSVEAIVVATATDDTIVVLPSSHEELLTTISAAHSVLLDMAAALRGITQEEAQELGEVALEVANMFVWSLRMVYSNMMQMIYNENDKSADDLSQRAAGTKQVRWGNANSSSSNLVPLVEILGEEEKKDEHSSTSEGTTTPSGRYTPQLPTIPSSPPRYVSHSIPERVRVLWPPLLPAVTDASKHCIYTAKENPLAATAIGLTCAPAITAALIAGTPLLIADWTIQTSYDALSHHTPVVENLEKGAASALQLGRLSVLCTKLVIKQSLSVGERQIKRRGGVGKICEDVVGGAVDMATHPLETACKTWDGLLWIGGALKDTVGRVVESVNVQVDMH